MIIAHLIKRISVSAGNAVDIELNISLQQFLNYQHKTKEAHSVICEPPFVIGGDEGDRTPYLLNAIQALCRSGRKQPSKEARYALFSRLLSFRLFAIFAFRV